MRAAHWPVFRWTLCVAAADETVLHPHDQWIRELDGWRIAERRNVVVSAVQA